MLTDAKKIRFDSFISLIDIVYQQYNFIYKLKYQQRQQSENQQQYSSYMQAAQENLFINPLQLLPKLSTILISLTHETEEIKKIYEIKIKDLKKQIEGKCKNIEILNNKIQQLQKKCFQLEHNIHEKDSSIEELLKKIRNIQHQLKKQLHGYIQHLDLARSIENTISSNKASQQFHKRINISEYFIKAIEYSKASTKIQNDTPNQSSNNGRNSQWLTSLGHIGMSNQNQVESILYGKTQGKKINQPQNQNRLQRAMSVETAKFIKLNDCREGKRMSDSSDELSIIKQYLLTNNEKKVQKHNTRKPSKFALNKNEQQYKIRLQKQKQYRNCGQNKKIDPKERFLLRCK